MTSLDIRVPLLIGLAESINDEGVGTYSATGPLPVDGFGVKIGTRPETPSKLISLNWYGVTSDAKNNDTVLGVQFWIRGDEDPRTIADTDAAIFNLFQGMHDTTVNGVPVALMWWQSGLPMPPDQNNRLQCTSNYYVRTAWPTTYRLDD
jgi:hypothetical protein